MSDLYIPRRSGGFSTKSIIRNEWRYQESLQDRRRPHRGKKAIMRSLRAILASKRLHLRVGKGHYPISNPLEYVDLFESIIPDDGWDERMSGFDRAFSTAGRRRNLALDLICRWERAMRTDKRLFISLAQKKMLIVIAGRAGRTQRRTTGRRTTCPNGSVVQVG
jgi:hypothetical protein